MSSRSAGTIVSISVHLVLLAAAFAIARIERQPVDEQPQAAPVHARLVFVLDSRPGGAGGTGGKRQTLPPREAKAIGNDRVDAPIAPPPTVQPAPLAAVEPIVAPVLPALSMGASTELRAGVMEERPPAAPDSAGPGSNGGAGNGPGGGVGRGAGPGLDLGERGGIGGNAFRVGGSVAPPRLLFEQKPLYTADAMKARISGRAILECIVEVDGSVSHIRIVRSVDPVHGLDEEAIRALKTWRFAPGTRFGEPVPVRITVETAFTLH